MSDALMRFGGVYLSHNPRELKIERRKKVLTQNDTEYLVKEEASYVRGKGELFGENCFNALDALKALRKSNKIAILALPNLGAGPAVLTKLSAAAGSRKDHVEVEFEFRLTDAKKHPEITYEDTYYAFEGENLWDIAEYFKADVNELIRLNTHIPDIRFLREGEKVRLR